MAQERQVHTRPLPAVGEAQEDWCAKQRLPRPPPHPNAVMCRRATAVSLEAWGVNLGGATRGKY